MKPSLVWFRADLRLHDQPALAAARERGGPVIPIFLWAPEEEAPWAPGAASRWWLHQSLQALEGSLRELGSRLILRCGPAVETLPALLRETKADAVFWNRRYEPAMIARDTRLKDSLRSSGVIVESFNAALLHEPWTISNPSRKPFQVFTPFWKHCLTQPDPEPPRPAPSSLPAPNVWPRSARREELKLEPILDWAAGLRRAWQPGETGARLQLERFLKTALPTYSELRDRPDQPGTSRLSPHLHHGEISPREIWHALAERAATALQPAWRSSQFLTELGWREFAHHLLFHFPTTPEQPLRTEFRRFPWRKDAALLKGWQQGRTGYPIVDAGMRELWATGFMHNRVRMVVASFLVKDLLLSWTEGARWFWDTLVDADLAQNTLGWQWSAGCGADAAPYFRIFNPVSQGEKFDPQGAYVRQWCPELAALPDEWLHSPWEAPADVLASAKVILGRTYPEPMVNHTIAREVALEAFQRTKALVRPASKPRRRKSAN